MRFLPGVLLTGALLIDSLFAADFRTPAGTKPARRTGDGSGTVLPGGRFLSPYGAQYTTGPGPFGLAISPSGRRIITSNGGPDRYSLTILENANGVWSARTLHVHGKDDEDADEWKSAFMGLAFDGEDAVYASEGES